jgi:hypothetical protein
MASYHILSAVSNVIAKSFELGKFTHIGIV